jgi:hypothetical protein
MNVFFKRLFSHLGLFYYAAIHVFINILAILKSAKKEKGIPSVKIERITFQD